MNMRRTRTLKVMFVSVFLLAALAFGVAANEVVLFEDDFEEDFLKDHWVTSGAIEPFNRLEPFDGALEFEGGVGNESFGIWATPMFDLRNGPLTIEVDLTREASNDWNEKTIWFVHEWMPDQEPWNNATFIRVQMASQGIIQIQKDF